MTPDRSSHGCVPVGLIDPPREFSLLPFWFWNDRLDAAEIVRQIDDFQSHGVFGFVIHPRMGLPRDIGFLSEPMLAMMHVAIEAAAARRMKVILYDEGMYPSGSASGQVVAADPLFHCRCIDRIVTQPGQALALPSGANLIASFGDLHVIDRLVDSVIRGIHFVDDAETIEHEPPAGDILNPQAVKTFIKIVHERFAREFGEHFGKTIMGIFTDEPNALGRSRERGIWPGTKGIVHEVSRLLGEDFTPHLPCLFDESLPGALVQRARYRSAIRQRLEETWYRPLQSWCREHELWLMGHPDHADDIGSQRYFDVPGQDLVWRWVLPDRESSLEGPESTQAKCSSSAMIHLGRTRNSNEFCGAYGHELTFDEMRWLAHWCFVRGVNLLIPHAFYYSVRGPRRDERPPDVGPNSAWWDAFRPFADACRRLSWINTDSKHVCEVAVLADPSACPWRAAKDLYEAQIDFNYLDTRQLIEEAVVSDEGVHLAGMCYRAVVMEPDLILSPALSDKIDVLRAEGRLITWGEDSASFVTEIQPLVSRDVVIDPPQPALRVRHVIKAGWHFYLLLNERRDPIAFRLHSPQMPLVRVNLLHDDAATSEFSSDDVRLAGHEMLVLGCAVTASDSD